ncbi:MAG TPA: hypothetical protein VFO55_03960 [Gemmatimonadaceae bacterium]|nr:hypothetical protein [Gemmatimonadaceae bacterium]
MTGRRPRAHPDVIAAEVDPARDRRRGDCRRVTPKGRGKSSVAIEQDGLPGREAVDAVKQFWWERFDQLTELLGNEG